MNETPLYRALRHLPDHEPAPHAWPQLADALTLAEACAQLPESDPEASTWTALEDRLDPPVRALRPRRWVSWAAAALAGVLLPLTWWLTRPSEMISYRQEIVEVPRRLPAEGTPPDAETLIRQRCAERAEVCRTPRFQELKREWDALAADRARLARQEQRFGADPDLHQALGRIEAVQAEVTTELLRLLTT